MGYKIAWIACDDRSLDAMIDALGMRRTGEQDDSSEAAFSGLALPNGWALIVNSFGYDTEFLLEGLDEPIVSQGKALTCYINETTMMSQLAAFSDGARMWSMTHDSERGPEDLRVVGVPPDQFQAIRRQAEGNDFSDNVFDIAPDLGEALTGFHHSKDAAAPYETLTR